MQVVAKPGLIVWQQDQLLKAILSCGYLPQEELVGDQEKIKQWKGRVISESQQITREAAKRGNDMHNRLEAVYTFGPTPEDLSDPFLAPIIKYMKEMFEGERFISEESFYHDLGFGGKVDLHSKAGDGLIIDFKTKADKAFVSNKSMIHDEHIIQLAAYRQGLALPRAECYNLFISTETPGKFELELVTDVQLKRGWEMFQCLLKYWQLEKNYIPGERKNEV